MSKFNKFPCKARLTGTRFGLSRPFIGSEVTVLGITFSGNNRGYECKIHNDPTPGNWKIAEEHLEPILPDYQSLAEQDVKRLKDRLRIGEGVMA